MYFCWLRPNSYDSNPPKEDTLLYSHFFNSANFYNLKTTLRTFDIHLKNAVNKIHATGITTIKTGLNSNTQTLIKEAGNFFEIH